METSIEVTFVTKTTVELDEKTQKIINKIQEKRPFITNMKSAIIYALTFFDDHSEDVERVKKFILTNLDSVEMKK